MGEADGFVVDESRLGDARRERHPFTRARTWHASALGRSRGFALSPIKTSELTSSVANGGSAVIVVGIAHTLIVFAQGTLL